VRIFATAIFFFRLNAEAAIAAKTKGISAIFHRALTKKKSGAAFRKKATPLV
jgi:hypothetical protein